MPINAMVTGGLGHIGSALVRSKPLQRSGPVIVVDDASSERYCSLFGLPDHARMIYRKKSVSTLSLDDVQGVDTIIHLAAQTDAAASVDQRERVFANNLGATRHIARLARLVGARLIFASTTSVYGSQESRVDETCQALLPQSPYAECKLEEEAAIQEEVTAGLDAVILRLGTIAGPSPGMRFHTAVNKFCLQAALREPLSVWRTAWTQVRPYLDIHDAVRGLEWAATRSAEDAAQGYAIYNVVTENLSVEEIVRSVEGAFGPLSIEFTESRIMNQLSYEVTAERIAQAGFVPTGSISGAIARTASLLYGVSGPTRHV